MEKACGISRDHIVKKLFLSIVEDKDRLAVARTALSAGTIVNHSIRAATKVAALEICCRDSLMRVRDWQ